MSIDPNEFDNTTEDPSGSIAPAPSPPDVAEGDPFSGRPQKIRVPENIASLIRDASGGDADLATVIAQVIYNDRRWGTSKNPVDQRLVTSVSDALKEKMPRPMPGEARPTGVPWSKIAASIFGGNDSGYAAALESITFSGTTASKVFAPALGGTSAAKQPLIPGLADDAAYAVQRVADSLFIQYLGRVPTPQEYINMSKAGWNAEQTEDWLRARPYGDSGATVGQKNDLRREMESVYQKVLGRLPTAEEVNFAAVNKIPLTDIQALAEQTRDGTVWHGDPTSYTDARTSVLDAFKKYGVSMTPQQLAKRFPNIVNQAVDGTMTDDQIDSLVSALPAPGLDGVDLGDAHRVRGLAKQWKDAYLPGQPLTDSEIKMFTKMSSTDIRDYYESLPLSMQRSIAGAQNITQFGQQVPGAPGPALPPQVAASSTTTPPAAVAGAPATAPAPAAPVPAAPNPQSKPNPLAGMDSVGHGSLVRDA